jgi:hypothetical protein
MGTCVVRTVGGLSARADAGVFNFGKSEISIDWSGKSVFYGAPGMSPGECDVRQVFRARRNFEAQWRFQEKLRQGLGRNSLSSLHQCRARPLLVLGWLGFLRLFCSADLAGAAWLDDLNLAVTSDQFVHALDANRPVASQRGI